MGTTFVQLECYLYSCAYVFTPAFLYKLT